MIDALRAVVRDHEASRPRSVQKAIGPSEAGTPCARRLAYRMLGVDPVNTGTDPWSAIVGTSVHAWLDDAFSTANNALPEPRWATSLRVTLPGYMAGTIDLFDDLTKTVIDFKVVGSTTMKRVKAGVISEQYKTQAHLYATGLRLAGHRVDAVGLMFWAKSGQLKDAVYWTEPYDEDVTERALARIDALKSTVDALGDAALELIPTSDGYCFYCPFFLPAVTDATVGCPGHEDHRIPARTLAADATTQPTKGTS